MADLRKRNEPHVSVRQVVFHPQRRAGSRGNCNWLRRFLPYPRLQCNYCSCRRRGRQQSTGWSPHCVNRDKWRRLLRLCPLYRKIVSITDGPSAGAKLFTTVFATFSDIFAEGLFVEEVSNGAIELLSVARIAPTPAASRHLLTQENYKLLHVQTGKQKTQMAIVFGRIAMLVKMAIPLIALSAKMNVIMVVVKKVQSSTSMATCMHSILAQLVASTTFATLLMMLSRKLIVTLLSIKTC